MLGQLFGGRDVLWIQCWGGPRKLPGMPGEIVGKCWVNRAKTKEALWRTPGDILEEEPCAFGLDRHNDSHPVPVGGDRDLLILAGVRLAQLLTREACLKTCVVIWPERWPSFSNVSPSSMRNNRACLACRRTYLVLGFPSMGPSSLMVTISVNAWTTAASLARRPQKLAPPGSPTCRSNQGEGGTPFEGCTS